MPMIAGSTPTDAWLSTVPSGDEAQLLRARVADITTTAAAPSLMPDALPAVTVPASRLNAGRSLASPSTVVPARGPSSLSMIRGPRRSGTSIGTISSSNRRSSTARAAFSWLAAANSSWASRVIPYWLARFSAVIPMWMSPNASVRPSWTIESISVLGPRRAPKRAAGARYGARDMFSIPPATTISASPARIICDAIATAFSPEPQSMLIVVAGTSFGMPAPSAAWRAGFCPSPACSTHPEHDLVDRLPGDPDPLERGAHGVRTERRRRHVLERSAEGSDRRSHRAHDHGFFLHRALLLGRAGHRAEATSPSARPPATEPRGYPFVGGARAWR